MWYSILKTLRETSIYSITMLKIMGEASFLLHSGQYFLIFWSVPRRNLDTWKKRNKKTGQGIMEAKERIGFIEQKSS